jgi:hypothetical protein
MSEKGQEDVQPLEAVEPVERVAKRVRFMEEAQVRVYEADVVVGLLNADQAPPGDDLYNMQWAILAN